MGNSASSSIVNTKDRIRKDVSLPRKKYLQNDILYKNEVIQPMVLYYHFYHEGLLSIEQASNIISLAIKIFSKESNLLSIKSSVTICGDVHGQYFDLITIFKKNGFPSRKNKYLFLGDYVDRGFFSFECFILLCAFKISQPNSVFLLRGNHESERMTSHFTFKTECLHKYNTKIYKELIQCFNCLPLVAVIEEKIFCSHGGISPAINYLYDIEKINRFKDIPSNGPFCDLLWSDPHPSFGFEKKKNILFSEDVHFIPNKQRGCSHFYTYKGICLFLEKNDLLCIVRGHEVQQDGYHLYREYKTFPSIISVFSAPNYAGAYQNKGAYLTYEEDGQINIHRFKHKKHPFVLPNFNNVFEWSIPFLSEHVELMLSFILELCLEIKNEQKDKEELKLQIDGIKNKVTAIGKLSHMFFEMRKKTESTSELSDISHSVTDLGNILSIKDEEIKQSLYSFEDAHLSDLENEKIPL